ncbi:hypothetical protein ANCDUO_14481 [Ancylostoma duodenale]|uniref:SH2 domain-containing protein n=1 Tax=Ancylostoma duodenale TaxID=51022 RepID=A0A0C2GE94_9BILA|nr:hypothetical protein ANCDUO_14481 [Ancylostoma duodenale]
MHSGKKLGKLIGAEIGGRGEIPGDLSISMRGVERNKHFKVQTIGGQLHIGSRAFPSMTSLIQHYTANPIFSSGTEKLYLTRPLANIPYATVAVARGGGADREVGAWPPFEFTTRTVMIG